MTGNTVNPFRVGRLGIKLGNLVFCSIRCMALQADGIFAGCLVFYALLGGITHNHSVESAMNGILECSTVGMHGSFPLLVYFFMA